MSEGKSYDMLMHRGYHALNWSVSFINVLTGTPGVCGCVPHFAIAMRVPVTAVMRSTSSGRDSSSDEAEEESSSITGKKSGPEG